MERKSDNFSPDDLKNLAQSDAGRQLLAMLRGSDAARLVHSGQMEAAQKAISAFLADPKAQALVKKLEEQSHG